MPKIDLSKFRHYRLPGGWHVHLRKQPLPWPLRSSRPWRWVACTPSGGRVGTGRAGSRWDAERAVQQAIGRYRRLHGSVDVTAPVDPCPHWQEPGS